jgi:PAS domain S-box-containing protein
MVELARQKTACAALAGAVLTCIKDKPKAAPKINVTSVVFDQAADMLDTAPPSEEALSFNQASMRALLELAPDAIFVADIEGRYTYVNTAGLRMLGYARHEIIGRTIFDFISHEDADRLLRSKAAMLTGRTDAGEWMLRRKDGTWVTVEVNANILADGQWLGFARDISSRKAQQAEREALFEQVERDRRWLDAVMDKMPLGAMLFDADGKIFFNQRAEQLLGMKLSAGGGAEQYVGRVFYPDGRPVPQAEFPSTRLLRGETVLGAEYTIRRPDGTEVTVLGSGGPIVDGDGRVLGAVGVFQDISERMGLERAVRENERLLKAVFDLLPVGVWIADRFGRITRNNPAGESVWRGARYVPVAQFGEYKGWWVDSGKPIAAEEWALARALTQGETSLGELVRIQCFDGSFKTIINSAAPLRDEEGGIAGAIVVNEDVTALHQTQEQLRAAVRDREHILAVVAHDLRNPLNAIMLRAALAEQKARKLPGAQDLGSGAAAIGEVARSMSGLVDDLLAISAARSGRSMLKFVPVQPAVVVSKAAEAAQPLLAHAGLQLVVEPMDELPSIHIDLDRILRVFANLIDNAMKFTERAGRIVVRAQSEHGVVQFSVANSGPALRPEEMERLFQPFWQAGHEDRRGAGLGLSICRSIIEAHGGSIWSEPADGMRVKICFVLPCVKPATAVAVRGDPAPRLGPHGGGS